MLRGQKHYFSVLETLPKISKTKKHWPGSPSEVSFEFPACPNYPPGKPWHTNRANILNNLEGDACENKEFIVTVFRFCKFILKSSNSSKSDQNIVKISWIPLKSPEFSSFSAPSAPEFRRKVWMIHTKKTLHRKTAWKICLYFRNNLFWSDLNYVNFRSTIKLHNL